VIAHPRLRAALLQRRRGRVSGTGAPQRRRADGYEFAELREYVEGDDPRRIDWAATARAGALQTRVLYEDHALSLAVLLDASRSMFVGRARPVYDDAWGALRIWYGLAASDDRCVRVSGARAVGDPRRRGPAAAHVCSAERDEAGSNFSAGLRTALAVVPLDASLLVVSDFFGIAHDIDVLRALAARCDVTALVVRDPWHDGLPLGGFVRLRDAESGNARRFYVGCSERERFTAAVAARERDTLGVLHRAGLRATVLGGDAERALAEAFGI
jgi:uncharacterized protein (DUF58 family)